MFPVAVHAPAVHEGIDDARALDAGDGSALAGVEQADAELGREGVEAGLHLVQRQLLVAEHQVALIAMPGVVQEEYRLHAFRQGPRLGLEVPEGRFQQLPARRLEDPDIVRVHAPELLEYARHPFRVPFGELQRLAVAAQVVARENSEPFRTARRQPHQEHRQRHHSLHHVLSPLRIRKHLNAAPGILPLQLFRRLAEISRRGLPFLFQRRPQVRGARGAAPKRRGRTIPRPGTRPVPARRAGAGPGPGDIWPPLYRRNSTGTSPVRPGKEVPRRRNRRANTGPGSDPRSGAARRPASRLRPSPPSLRSLITNPKRNSPPLMRVVSPPSGLPCDAPLRRQETPRHHRQVGHGQQGQAGRRKEGPPPRVATAAQDFPGVSRTCRRPALPRPTGKVSLGISPAWPRGRFASRPARLPSPDRRNRERVGKTPVSRPKRLRGFSPALHP